MKTIENPIKAGESQDLGVAIQNLIKDNIRGINTAFLAKVQSIAGENKANITPLLKNDSKDKETIIPNILIAQPATKGWALNYKVEVGDIGLAIVCQNDISTYKKSGDSGIVNTQRRHDIIDSIFMPLSLFINKSSEGITLENEGGDCSLALNDEGITIKGQKFNLEASEVTIKGQSAPLEIGNSVGTLVSVTDAIFQAMDLLSTGLTGPSSNPSAYQGGKSALQAQIKQILK